MIIKVWKPTPATKQKLKLRRSTIVIKLIQTFAKCCYNTYFLCSNKQSRLLNENLTYYKTFTTPFLQVQLIFYKTKNRFVQLNTYSAKIHNMQSNHYSAKRLTVSSNSSMNINPRWQFWNSTQPPSAIACWSRRRAWTSWPWPIEIDWQPGNAFNHLKIISFQLMEQSKFWETYIFPSSWQAFRFVPSGQTPSKASRSLAWSGCFLHTWLPSRVWPPRRTT